MRLFFVNSHISNYCYGNTVNRCYCTIIKHINKVLSSVNSCAKNSGSSLLQTECDCQLRFTSKLFSKLALNDHRNNPRPYKSHTTERLLKIHNKYMRGSCMFCSGMVEKPSSYDESEFCSKKELVFRRQDHLCLSAFK